MASERAYDRELRNETAINVAGLLKAAVGATRLYRLELDRFPLGDGLEARTVSGEVKLTRLREAVMAKVAVEGVAALECARCLRSYDQPFSAAFSEEYRQTVDVRTGLGLAPAGDEDDDTGLIDDNHELDVGEVLRQETLLALPMRPDCGEGCPGPDAAGTADDEASDAPPVGAAADERLAVLAGLLDDETE